MLNTKKSNGNASIVMVIVILLIIVLVIILIPNLKSAETSDDSFSKAHKATIDMEIQSLKDYMGNAQAEALIYYRSEGTINLQSIIKNNFTSYKIIDSTSLSYNSDSETSGIIGTMTLEGASGIKYKLDFSNNTVTQE